MNHWNNNFFNVNQPERNLMHCTQIIQNVINDNNNYYYNNNKKRFFATCSLFKKKEQKKDDEFEYIFNLK